MGIRDARKVLEAFFKTTTCHGLSQVRLSKKVQAVAWLMCALIMALFCLIQLMNIMGEYLKKEVIAKTEVRSALQEVGNIMQYFEMLSA